LSAYADLVGATREGIAIALLLAISATPATADEIPAQPDEPGRLALEGQAALGLVGVFEAPSSLGLALDARALPWLSFNVAASFAGADGWSGGQYAALARAHESDTRRGWGWGFAAGLAAGHYGWREFSFGESDVFKEWDRAYLAVAEASLEKAYRSGFRLRWRLGLGAVLNRDDYTCQSEDSCPDAGGTTFATIGLALGYDLVPSS
jgi:hypothetical protein